GLSVVDLTSLSSPRILGTSKDPFYAERVAITGNTAVMAGATSGLWVVDLTTYRVVDWLQGNVRAVAAAGNYGYMLEVICGNPSHTDLEVLDVSDPAAGVQVVGRVTVAGNGGDIVLSGNYAYVATASGGIQIVNIGVPTAPSVVSTLDTPGTAVGIALGGNY